MTDTPGDVTPPPVGRGRVLVAGMGNVLRRDDGFGIAVIAALQERPDALPPETRVIEVGIGGIGLIQELMDGYDALVLVDAVDRGGEPGTLYVLDPEVPDVAALAPEQRRIMAADMHELVPSRSLVLAAALNVLPARVRIIGCQPAETDELSMELTPTVAAAVSAAVAAVVRVARELGGAAASDPAEPIRRRDELLQVMYWMRGEGLGDAVSPEEVGRLLADTPGPLLAADLRSLCEAGLAEPAGGARYRLTEAGAREGARRFAEAFADYMKPGHGACSDPGCDCHTLGPDACVHAHDGRTP